MFRIWFICLVIAAMALTGCYNIEGLGRTETNQGWQLVAHADAPLFTMPGWGYAFPMVKDTRIFGEWYGAATEDIPALIINEDNTYEYTSPYARDGSVVYYGTWVWGHQQGILLSLPDNQYVAIRFKQFSEDEKGVSIFHWDSHGSFNAVLHKVGRNYIVPANLNHL